MVFIVLNKEGSVRMPWDALCFSVRAIPDLGQKSLRDNFFVVIRTSRARCGEQYDKTLFSRRFNGSVPS